MSLLPPEWIQRGSALRFFLAHADHLNHFLGLFRNNFKKAAQMPGMIHKWLPPAVLALGLAACASGAHERMAARIGQAAQAKPLAREAQCQAGDLESCRKLGVDYQTGNGVSAAPDRAADYYDRACRGGNGRACYNFGNFVLGGDLGGPGAGRAVVLFQQACDLNYISACTNLGVMFQAGAGVPRSIKQAIILFDHACRDGDAAGCENLAAIAMAQGQPESIRWAREKFERSCANNIPLACSNLASTYLRGKPSAAELEKARSLLVGACDAKEPSGCYNLAELLRTRLRESADPARVVHLFQQACDGNVAMACRRLAESYELGEGVVVDLVKAALAKSRACTLGDRASCGDPASRQLGSDKVPPLHSARPPSA